MAKFNFSILFILLFCLNAFSQKEVKPFLDKNTNALKLSDTTDFSDLECFDDLLKGKRIVMLGEFNHGAKEIFLMKNRLIEYLHEKHGFDLVLMESGVGEMIQMNNLKDSLRAEQLVFSGLMGPWLTEEFAALMSYFKSQNDLYLGGYDPQKTGSSFSKVLKEILREQKAEVLNNALDLESENNAFIRQMKKQSKDSSMLAQYQKLVRKYLELELYLADNQEDVLGLSVDSLQLKLVLQTIKNRIWYLDYYFRFKEDNNWSKRFAARDSAMSMNVEFFLDHLFPNKKVIICGHNFHISKYNESQLTMGEKVSEKYGNEVFAIGFFGGNGKYASNSREIKKLTAPEKENDLRKIMLHSENEISFLPFSATYQKGGEWLDQDVTITDSFINLSKGDALNLKKTFDALIFIKNISPPEYLKWE